MRPRGLHCGHSPALLSRSAPARVGSRQRRAAAVGARWRAMLLPLIHIEAKSIARERAPTGGSVPVGGYGVGWRLA